MISRLIPSSFIALSLAGVAYAQFSVFDPNLNGFTRPGLAFGDYDVDGDLDVVQTGFSGGGQFGWLGTRIFRNDGNGRFSVTTDTFTGLVESQAAWADLDGDNDLDLVINGWEGTRPFLEAYVNESGTFRNARLGLTGAWGGGLNTFDADGDGDQDIVVSGNLLSAGANDPVLIVYRNDGNLNFVDTRQQLEGTSLGGQAVGDLDGDGDVDIAVTGEDIFRNTTLRVFTNDGTGRYTQSALLPGLSQGRVEFVDIDGDSDLDLSVNGGQSTMVSEGFTRVYRNDAGVFTEVGLGLPGVVLGDVTWADFDNDGLVDLAYSGGSRNFSNGNNQGPPTVQAVLKNLGNGQFSTVAAPLVTGYDARLAWVDVDGDLDLDLFQNAFVFGSATVTQVLKNNQGRFSGAAPRSGSMTTGTWVRGTAMTTRFSDDQRLAGRSVPAVRPGAPNLAMEFTSRRISASPSVLDVTVEARLETPAGIAPTQSVELFDRSAGKWVLVGTSSLTTRDTVVNHRVSASPARFVDANGEVRTRVSWASSSGGWTVSVDRVNWTGWR